MKKNIKRAWLIGKRADGFRYGEAAEQIKILSSEARSEGYIVSGSTELEDGVFTEEGQELLRPMMERARDGRLDAVFVMSILHISSNRNTAFRFIDQLNELGVVVYDNEGYTYSYDWTRRQMKSKE